MYCPTCGIDHHASEAEEAARKSEEVEIERLRTHRDIEVARINANVVKDEAVMEAVAVAAEAEGMEAGLQAGADAVTPDPPEIVEPEPVPVIVHDEPEPEPDVPPPPADDSSHAQPAEHKKPGWWDGYR